MSLTREEDPDIEQALMRFGNNIAWTIYPTGQLALELHAILVRVGLTTAAAEANRGYCKLALT
jgi:hypothetical protein